MNLWQIVSACVVDKYVIITHHYFIICEAVQVIEKMKSSIVNGSQSDKTRYKKELGNLLSSLLNAVVQKETERWCPSRILASSTP